MVCRTLGFHPSYGAAAQHEGLSGKCGESGKNVELWNWAKTVSRESSKYRES